MNENPHDRDTEHENNEAPSSSVPYDGMESITIIFASFRHGEQHVSVQALLNKSEKLSTVSYNLAKHIRNIRGEPTETDFDTLNLNWRVAETGWGSYNSNFKVVGYTGVHVVLGKRDCKQFERHRDQSRVGDNIFSFFCHKTAAEQTRQDAEAPIIKLKNDKEKAEESRIMEEKDRKRREALLQAKSSRGQGSGGQQGSSQNS